MKKAFLALCMMLCVSLAATALAAPCRDVRTEGRDAELENAVSLFAGAALMRDVTDFTEGEAVPQPLAEGVLLLGFGRHLLASTDGNPSDETETADAAALQPILSSLFSGDSQVPETPSCPCITSAVSPMKPLWTASSGAPSRAGASSHLMSTSGWLMSRRNSSPATGSSAPQIAVLIIQFSVSFCLQWHKP